MNIDTLDIQFKSSGAEQVQSSLNNLVGSITRLNTSLNQMNGTGLSSFASGLNRLGNSVKGVTSIRSTSIDTIVNKFNKLSNIKSESLISSSKALETFSKSMQGLKIGESSLKSVKEVSDAMKTFGNKSFSNASENIKKLTVSLKEMMSSLSGVKNVNKSVIEMTNAMANLASQSKGLNALQFTSSVKNVGTESKKSSSGLNTFGNSLKDTNKHVKNSSNGMIELARTFGKFYASMFLVIRAFRSLGEAIKTAMDYTETYNYFNVVTDKMAQEFPEGFRQLGEESADAYYMSFRDKMTGLFSKMTGFNVGENGELTSSLEKNLGADPNLLMNYQARIASITNSVGQMGQVSTITSNALSMLAYDLSSLTNTDVETVMNNLASGLLGQARAMYAYGVDITNATLQQYALQYGIQKSVSEMTQMEKQQLRLIAILDQTRVAWTDQASTIMSVSNQYRMLQANLHKVAQTIGNLFLPIVQKVLPYLNAIVIVIQRILQLLGFKIHGDNWLKNLQDGTSQGFGGALEDIEDMEDAIGGAGSGMEDVADNANEAQKNLDKAKDKAKKLRDYVLGIDELNIIKPQDDNDDDISKDIDALSKALKNPSGGSGGKGGGGGIDLSDAIEDLYMDYENAWLKALEDSANKVEEIVNKIWEALKKLWDIAEPTRKALADLWNNGLKKLMEFNGKTLYDFWKNFLQPIGLWLLSDNSGLPRLFRILNDMLEKVDWFKLQTQLRNLYTALQEIAKFTWNSLMGFLEYFLAPLATWTMSSAIPQLANILTQFIYSVNWDKITESLNNFWKALEPFAENVGQGLINFFESLMKLGASFLNNVVPNLFNGLATALNMIPRGLAEALGEELGFLLISILALKGINKVTSIFGKFSKEILGLIGIRKGIDGTVKSISGLASVWTTLNQVIPLGVASIKNVGASMGQFASNVAICQKNGLGFTYVMATLEQGFNKLGHAIIDSVKKLGEVHTKLSAMTKISTVVITAFMGFKSITSVIEDVLKGVTSLEKGIGQIVIACGAMGIAFTVALGPIGGLLAVIATLGGAFAYAVAEQKKMTDQYSDSAKELQAYGQSVDDLTQKIYNQGMAIEESNDKILRSRDEIMASEDAELLLAQDLVDMYFNLAEQTVITGEEQGLMKEYLDKLCEVYPELSQYVDTQTGLLAIERDTVHELIDAEMERAKAEAIYQLMVEAEKNLIQAQIEEKQALDQAEVASKEYQTALENVSTAEQDLKTAEQELALAQRQGYPKEQIDEYRTKVEEAKTTLADYQTELDRTEQNYNDIENSLRELSKSEGDSINTINELKDVYVEFNEEASQKAEETANKIEEETTRTVGQITDATGEIQTVTRGGITTVLDEVGQAGTEIEGTVENTLNNVDGTVQGSQFDTELGQKAQKAVDDFSKALGNGMPSDVARQMLEDVNKEFEGDGIKLKMNEAGQYYVEGFTQGLEQATPQAVEATNQFTETENTTMQTGLGEASPSKITEEDGKYYIEGFTNGLTGNKQLAIDTVNQICTEINEAFATAMTSSGESAEGGEGGIFGGLLNGFKTACTSIIDYVTTDFVPLLTETFTSVFGMEGESGGVFEGMYTSFQTTCQKILEYIPTFTNALTQAFTTAFGSGSFGEAGGDIGLGGGGLFGGMFTSFQSACQQIIDYVLMTFVPLLTSTFATAFGGGMGMGGMGMMGGGIGGAGIGGGVGGMGMGLDGMSGGLFGGMFMNFQMTCQMMVDYILSSFLPMLTEALLTFVDMLQTDVLDVITENVIAFLELMTEEVITPFLDSTLELFGEYIEMLNEMLEEESEYILELAEEIADGICDAIDTVIDKIEEAIDKIEEAIDKLKEFLSMGGGSFMGAGSAKNGGIIRHRSEGGFVPHFASGGIVKGKGGYSIEAYASGNFSTADLFYANENGVPELVGTLNGHTAVASGKEITGISNAIYESSSKEVSAMNTMIGYLQTIASKNTSLSIDSRELVTAIDNRRVRNGFSFT